MMNLLEPKTKDYSGARILEIDLDRLEFHPENSIVFKQKGEEFISMLARDIELHGLNEPIEINPQFVVLSGENRVKAFRMLGKSTIPAKIVNVENELEYLISRNIGRRQIVHSDRILIYKKVFPKVFTMQKINSSEIDELSRRLYIPKKTIESDFTKIRNGKSKEVTLEKLRELWEKNNIKDVRINIVDMGTKGFMLQVEAKKHSYEFGPDSYKNVIRKAFHAAQNSIFNKKVEEKTSLNYKIRELRINAGLTQFQMAQKVGYSQSYISEFEAGRWEVPRSLYEQIRDICLELRD
jgi:DNA-binding XRE family transcriptional regulator/DNA-binding Xre family transcriptional regulator